MKVVKEYTGVVYCYDSVVEYQEHCQVMRKNGYIQVDSYTIEELKVCVEYRYISKNSMKQLSDILNKYRARNLVVKSATGDIIFNGETEWFLKEKSLLRSRLERQLVVSKLLQNDILTVVLKC